MTRLALATSLLLMALTQRAFSAPKVLTLDEIASDSSATVVVRRDDVPTRSVELPDRDAAPGEAPVKVDLSRWRVIEVLNEDLRPPIAPGQVIEVAPYDWDRIAENRRLKASGKPERESYARYVSPVASEVTTAPTAVLFLTGDPQRQLGGAIQSLEGAIEPGSRRDDVALAMARNGRYAVRDEKGERIRLYVAPGRVTSKVARTLGLDTPDELRWDAVYPAKTLLIEATATYDSAHEPARLVVTGSVESSRSTSLPGVPVSIPMVSGLRRWYRLDAPQTFRGVRIGAAGGPGSVALHGLVALHTVTADPLNRPASLSFAAKMIGADVELSTDGVTFSVPRGAIATDAPFLAPVLGADGIEYQLARSRKVLVEERTCKEGLSARETSILESTSSFTGTPETTTRWLNGAAVSEVLRAIPGDNVLETLHSADKAWTAYLSASGRITFVRAKDTPRELSLCDTRELADSVALIGRPGYPHNPHVRDLSGTLKSPVEKAFAQQALDAFARRSPVWSWGPASRVSLHSGSPNDGHESPHLEVVTVTGTEVSARAFSIEAPDKPVDVRLPRAAFPPGFTPVTGTWFELRREGIAPDGKAP